MDLSPSSHEAVRIPLTSIVDNPYQVRSTYDESAVTALATSIAEVGLLQIPVARKVGDSFQMAFGHRRKRAFEKLALLGLSAYETMPLIVLELSDREMLQLAISENVKRADLGPLEKAKALKRFMNEFGATSEEVAQLFEMKAATVRATIRLLNLPEEAKQKLQNGQLTPNAARKILEKPETELRRLDGAFDLRTQLIVLLYDRDRGDVPDQRIFKKIQSIVDENKQLRNQVELMNSKARARDRMRSTRAQMHAGPVTSR